jgi:predicted nucleic acid-binding protein
MRDKFFVDTNLWIYLHSTDSILEKNKKVVSLIDDHFEDIIISTQVLGEIFSVLIKKGFKKKEQAKEIILNLSEHFEVIGISEQTVRKAVDLSLQYNFSHWDSLIVSSALESGCTILYTEDMQHGQVIENTLTITILEKKYSREL